MTNLKIDWFIRKDLKAKSICWSL